MVANGIKRDEDVQAALQAGEIPAGMGEGAVAKQPETVEDWDKYLSLTLYENVGARIPRAVFMVLEHSGSGVYWLPLVPLIWLSGLLSAQARTFAANLYLGLWIDIALIGVLKGIFRRKRPVYNHKGDFTVIVAVDQFSFPSGHSSRVGYVAAFAVVGLALANPRLAGGVVAWALTVALSRALMGRHYLGDITAGLALGVVTTALLTRWTFTLDGCWISTALSEEWHRRAVAWFNSHLPQLLPALRIVA